MTTPDIARLCERLRRLRDKYLLATPDKDDTDYAIMTRSADTLERQAAEIAALRDEVVEARTLDKGFYEWMIERDLLARGEEVEWGDIVVALTEHEIEITKADERQAAEIERLRGALGGINQLARDRLAPIPADLAPIPADLVHSNVIGQLLFDILGRAALTGEDHD
jgi:hypothetical protein